jgi:hypothetical protein
MLDGAAVLQVGGDAGCPERVATLASGKPIAFSRCLIILKASLRCMGRLTFRSNSASAPKTWKRVLDLVSFNGSNKFAGRHASPNRISLQCLKNPHICLCCWLLDYTSFS